ncbi:uncharacterized protein ISCGN_024104 [Ixodes scapularis]
MASSDSTTDSTPWRGIALRQPDSFDFLNAELWPSWLSQYEDYALASGVSSAPEDVHVRLLLYCMGSEARRLLQSFSLSGEAPYNVVVRCFTEHFVHPVNEVYKSSRFHRRVQQAEETVDTFYTELMRLVKQYNYGTPEAEERLVRDRFVVGLRDSRLSDRLERNPKLTLKDAWVQAR